MPMWAARTAFESRASRTSAASIWSAAAIVSAAVIAIASAAAEGPLETGSRIAADARGVAREILARFRGAGARGARFTGKKNTVILRDGGGRRRFGSGGLQGFMAGFLVPDFFVNFVIADGRGMQGAFVGCIGFGFAERVRIQSPRLDRRDLFIANVLGLNLYFASVNFFGFFRSFLRSVFYFFLIVVFFFENRATDERVGCGFRLSFFMLGFDQAGRNYGDILFAQGSVGARWFLLDDVWSGGKRLRRCGCGIVGGRSQFFCASRGGFGFVAGFRKQPARQPTRGTPRNICTTRRAA